MTRIKVIFAIAVAIPLILMSIGMIVILRDYRNATTETPIATVPTVGTVNIALLDTAGETNGKSRGCDKVVLLERSIATTTQPLNAALRELFSLTSTSVDGYYNFMAKTTPTLHFDYATIEQGTARVYVTGSLSGLAGVCDDPRAQIQIEETALQFGTVKRVDIYLNGVKTKITPDERG